MIEIIIVFTFYSFLMEVMSKPYIIKIQASSTVNQALSNRKKLLTMRWVFTILFVAIYIGPGIVIHGFDFWITENRLVPLLIYIITYNGFKRLKGNISILTKDIFLKKHNSFALYLRGFQSDDYKLHDLCPDDISKFSEQFFIDELNKFIPSCAIGMTKEADSPWGAERVYVSDENWKENVSELMLKAKYIFVLLNNRPSCIWEITQLKDMLYKTYFFVDDIKKFNVVKDKLKGIINFPEINQLNLTIPFCLHLDNKTHKIDMALSFVSSKEGYKFILENVFHEMIQKQEYENKKYQKLNKICWFIIALPFICLLNYKLSFIYLSALNSKSMVWGITLMILLFIIEWIVYMLIKVHVKTKRIRNKQRLLSQRNNLNAI